MNKYFRILCGIVSFCTSLVGFTEVSIGSFNGHDFNTLPREMSVCVSCRQEIANFDPFYPLFNSYIFRGSWYNRPSFPYRGEDIGQPTVVIIYDESVYQELLKKHSRYILIDENNDDSKINFSKYALIGVIHGGTSSSGEASIKINRGTVFTLPDQSKILRLGYNLYFNDLPDQIFATVPGINEHFFLVDKKLITPQILRRVELAVTVVPYSLARNSQNNFQNNNYDKLYTFTPQSIYNNTFPGMSNPNVFNPNIRNTFNQIFNRINTQNQRNTKLEPVKRNFNLPRINFVAPSTGSKQQVNIESRVFKK